MSRNALLLSSSVASLHRRISSVRYSSFVVSNLFAQTKQTESVQQVWFGYFNQTRFSNKWGTWTDLHLRTKEDFVS